MCLVGETYIHTYVEWAHCDWGLIGTNRIVIVVVVYLTSQFGKQLECSEKNFACLDK